MKNRILLTALVACTAISAAGAQTGTDACTTPDPIAGQGSFPFITGTTGAEGQTEAICYAFGTSAVNNDVWFDWTADATGTAVLSTCTATIDTKIAAYPASGCPTAATSLACNDDTCGLQSTISFPVTAATIYTLQVGTFSAAASGSGNLDIVIAGPAVNDSCGAPTVIAGQGSFAFNNLGGTTGTEGQAEPLCYSLGASGVDADVWYTWTADITGTANINTCASAVDTKLALYPGAGCPTTGTALACNDDSCGTASQILFGVTAGTVYTIQAGVSPGSTGGVGTVDIVIIPPLLSDDCSLPNVIAGQGIFPYDSTIATTGAEGQSEAICYAFGTSGINNDIWFSWTPTATGPATVTTCLVATMDTKLASYPGGGCPTAGTSLACNDDTCGLQSEIIFNVVAGTSYMLQVGNFPGAAGGVASIDISVVGPAEPGTGFCFCDGGNDPCGNPGAAGNGCGNSANTNGANLTASGTAIVGSDTLVLSATGLRPNQPGLYLQGENAISGGAGIVFGDGLRCAGLNVVRLVVVGADASGASDTSGFATAISVKGGVTAGDLRHYQLWYRDPNVSPCGSDFNLTNGYSIQW